MIKLLINRVVNNKLTVNTVKRCKLTINRVYNNHMIIENFKQFIELNFSSTAFGSFDVVKRTILKLRNMVKIEYHHEDRTFSRMLAKAKASSTAKVITDTLNHIKLRNTVKDEATYVDEAKGSMRARLEAESTYYAIFNTFGRKLFRNRMVNKEKSQMLTNYSYRARCEVTFESESEFKNGKELYVKDFDPFRMSELDEKELQSFYGKYPHVVNRNNTENNTTVKARAEGLLK